MTVKELISELLKMPQDMRVEIGTITDYFGEAKRVNKYDDYVEIESDFET